MIRRFVRYSTLLLFIFCTACANGAPGGKTLPKLTFMHLKPVPINVGALKTESERGYIDEPFVVSPTRAVDDYVRARFIPQGYGDVLQITTVDATVDHSYEASGSQAGRYFDVAGRDVYDMKIKLRVEHKNDHDDVLMGRVLTVQRVLKLTEHSSIAEREYKQFQAMEAMFKELDAEILRIVLSEMDLGGP